MLEHLFHLNFDRIVFRKNVYDEPNCRKTVLVCEVPGYVWAGHRFIQQLGFGLLRGNGSYRHTASCGVPQGSGTGPP